MKLLLSILGITAGIYLLAMVGLILFQNRLTFQTVKMRPEAAFEFQALHKEVYLEDREENLKIHSLFFPAKESSNGIILYFHGNSGNLKRWGQYASDFTSLHYDFLAIDYPGYGKSSGKPSEEGFYASARLAYEWAAAKYKPSDIVIYGRSIGSGPASHLAARVDARLLILETPFYSFRDLSKKNPFLSIFPIPPKQHFPVNEHLEATNCEIALFHGTKDRVVPLSSAMRLKSLVPKSENFIIIPGGKHRNLSDFPEYHGELKRLLQRVPVGTL